MFLFILGLCANWLTRLTKHVTYYIGFFFLDLRVIDAGSMPSPPTGNPQGAIMAVAERGAHFIKETWK